MSTIAADVSTPITLLHSGLCAQVDGHFDTPDQRSSFTLSARAGETLIVNIIPQTPMLAMAGTVASSDGQQAGGQGGVIVNQVLTTCGTYTITAFQHTMASNLDEGDFVVEVVLLPSWLTSQNR